VSNGDRFGWLKGRSTTDLLVLLIAGTICISVLAYGLVVSILVLFEPQKNHGPAVALLANTFQLLIGLLAGFVAGRTEKGMQGTDEHAEPDHQ